MKQKAALEKHYAEGENLFLKTLNCIGCFLITGKTSCSSIQLGIIIEQLQGYLLYTLLISNPLPPTRLILFPSELRHGDTGTFFVM